MTSLVLFKYFLQVNLLLIFTFCLFKITRFLWAIAVGGADYQKLKKLGQSLLFLSLFVPMGLSWIPMGHLLRIDFRNIKPMSESGATHEQLKPVTAVSTHTETFGADDVRSTWSGIFHRVWNGVSPGSLLLLLLTGSFVGCFGLIRKGLHLRKLIDESISIREIGRVSVKISEAVEVPFSTLISGQASIVIPFGMVQRAHDFRIAISHELQHHRQGDTRWALWIELWVCFFYLNPFIYFWKREMIELQEFSCDEHLIRTKRIPAKGYGGCLLRVAEVAIRSRVQHAGITCMAAGTSDPLYFKSLLRRRIEMLIDYEQRKSQSISQKSFAWILSSAAVLATVTLSYGAQGVFRPGDPGYPGYDNKINPGIADFDPSIQAITEKILERAVEESKARAGFVLVSDPMTGKLLAAANAVRKQSPGFSQKHWALSYRMEPGSTIKAVMAAAALEKGVTQMNEVHNCEKGKYILDGHIYRDHTDFDHLTTTETIANSSDICGIKIGEKLGSSGLARALTDFGFGLGGSADGFPEARSGTFPGPDQVPASEYIPLIATGYVGTSQFYTTPLEMTQAFGAIANGGKLMKPLVASAQDASAKVIRRVQTEAHAEEMKAALVEAVIHGTGSNARSQLYSTAGKTSTGHYDAPPKDPFTIEKADFAGFIGFAPVTKPRLVVYAVMIDSKDVKHAYGNSHAAPVFRKVTEAILQHLGVAPDLKQ